METIKPMTFDNVNAWLEAKKEFHANLHREKISRKPTKRKSIKNIKKA